MRGQHADHPEGREKVEGDLRRDVLRPASVDARPRPEEGRRARGLEARPPRPQPRPSGSTPCGVGLGRELAPTCSRRASGTATFVDTRRRLRSGSEAKREDADVLLRKTAMPAGGPCGASPPPAGTSPVVDLHLRPATEDLRGREVLA